MQNLKLTLSAIQDRGIEVLSREQMNDVLGKMVGGFSGTDKTYHSCYYDVEAGAARCNYTMSPPSGAVWVSTGHACDVGDGLSCQEAPIGAPAPKQSELVP